MSTPGSDVPRIAFVLGLAGLVPQVLVVLALLGEDPATRFPALAFGYAYAALILSFLGGIWWGLAARAPARAPTWMWFAAVAPSLVALATAWPWMVGLAWPRPSLVVLAIALIAALAVDARLVALAVAPSDWMRLRMPLSLGLGLLTLVAALL